MRWIAPVLLAAATLVLAGGCSRPAMEGLHLPGGLTGFRFDPNSTKARKVFPDREVLDQIAWWAGMEDHDSIFATRYAGPSTPEEIEAARDAQEERYGRPGMEYGEVSAIVIDGRTGWAWLERQTFAGKLASLELKAVVSWDDVTYAVEFFAGRPEYQDEAKLREVVSRFEMGKTRPNTTAIATGVVALLLGIVVFRGVARAR